jgi:hypothetical protein
MTISAHSRAIMTQAGSALGTLAVPKRPASAVRLIDRRTGLTHRINGSPLVVFTRNPTEAVTELLSGRDASVWEARIEPIGGAA